MHIKTAGRGSVDDRPMLQRVIPIRPVSAAAPVLRPTLVQGDAGQVQRLRDTDIYVSAALA